MHIAYQEEKIYFHIFWISYFLWSLMQKSLVWLCIKPKPEWSGLKGRFQAKEIQCNAMNTKFCLPTFPQNYTQNIDWWVIYFGFDFSTRLLLLFACTSRAWVCPFKTTFPDGCWLLELEEWLWATLLRSCCPNQGRPARPGGRPPWTLVD